MEEKQRVFQKKLNEKVKFTLITMQETYKVPQHIIMNLYAICIFPVKL